MGVIAEGILRGCQGLFTPVSLGYPLSVFNKNSTLERRRVGESYDPSMVTALLHGTLMDEERFKKTCIKDKEKRGGIHQPLHGTWVTDSTLRHKKVYGGKVLD